jgi:hypothetical protein
MRSNDHANARGWSAELRATVALTARLAGYLDSTVNVAIDARQQTAVLASMSEDELRAMVRAAEERTLPPGYDDRDDVVDPAPALTTGGPA